MADNSMLMIGIVVVVLITAGLTYYIAKSGEAIPPGLNVTPNETGTQPTITVRGEATKTVMPDLVTLSLSIESFGNTTQDAQAQSAKDVAKLKTALLAAGVDESDIQTGSYYTYEVYNESCYKGCYYYADAGYEKMAYAVEPAYGGVIAPDYYPPPYPCERNCTIIGYKTTHTLTVESDLVNDSGELVDAATGAVNTSVDYIYFSVKEETRVKLETELQAAAAASARAKAESIAQGLGSKVGKIISVSPDYYYPYYPSYAYDSAVSSDGSVPTEIFPRETTMSSSMTVVFELE